MTSHPLEHLQRSSIHIIGISGTEGSAVAEYLAARGVGKLTGHDFCAREAFESQFNIFHDYLTPSERTDAFKRLTKLSMDYRFGDQYLEGIETADAIFVPQSWFRYPQNVKLKDIAPTKELWNITKLYFALAPCPIIAVTGTSGKTTTVQLIYEMLLADGKEAYLSGNDREHMQILDRIEKLSPSATVVLEVSNRQLMVPLTKGPAIGVVTNVSPNHLDDHGTIENYAAAKQSLLVAQTNTQSAVLNYDNPTARTFEKGISSHAYFFSRTKKLTEGAWLDGDMLTVATRGTRTPIIRTGECALPGEHNVENMLAAIVSARLAGVSPAAMQKTLESFHGLKTRMELVREVRGVRYVDDSSACAPHEVAMSIRTIPGPKILIMGGVRKTLYPGEFDTTIQALFDHEVRAVFLIGKLSHYIASLITEKQKNEKRHVIVEEIGTLAPAVQRAAATAHEGWNVILSPGCESFDQFKDYRDRSRQYQSLVHTIL